MMISGQKAAHLALKALGQPNAIDGTYSEAGGVQPELILAAAETGEIVVDAWWYEAFWIVKIWNK